MKRLLTLAMALMLSACASTGGSSWYSNIDYCKVLPPLLGAAAGGVAGSYLAGNSVTNNIQSTKSGGKFTVQVTKKQASDGTRALYTGGGVLIGGIGSLLVSQYLCPAPAPAIVHASNQNEALHQYADAQPAD